MEAADCDDGWRERWDNEEAATLKTVILPHAEELPDYTHIKDVFEKVIEDDASVAASLMEMIGHEDRRVAGAAASALGRFPSPEASSRLKQAFGEDARPWVRGAALAGLLRMDDPDTGPLAVQALTDTDMRVQVAGTIMLTRLRDSQYGPALLAYCRAHPDDWPMLARLGCLGDAPGSTVVRDGLLAEANNKSYDFQVHVAAADGLAEMALFVEIGGGRKC